jgi:glyoxylase-like metal-dependent hydrolase (beta-lactamase superfamily II)
MKPILPFLLIACLQPCLSKELPSAIRITPGPVNGITIRVGDQSLAINSSGGAACDALLLTHSRRDIIRTARDAGAKEVYGGGKTVAILRGAEDFWLNWWEKRFDYYQQQVTQLPTENWLEVRELPENTLEWNGLSIRILPTPGFTRDAVTFVSEIDGSRIAFVGDLLLEGGKVRDLYSFQNEIREAKIGGYHGHLGRLHVWLRSLEALRAEKPDFLIPSRGAVIAAPDSDISKAIQSAREIYKNYLSTNALHWYFGEDRMNTCAELVLGENHGVSSMPLAEHIELPEWCQHMGTTKLLVSKSGKGFALDVGGANALKTLQTAQSDGLISGLDGIFATHTHNDHTAAIAEAAKHFQSPVYALPEVADVLHNPGRWFLPGVSPNRVESVHPVKDGETMQWEEFTFTFRFYPGQMYNHGALLVEKEGHDPVFFIGDSFSPSGIDDYCMMNRNLMRDDTGYALCFRILDGLPATTWLVNQHIPHLFRFTGEEREFLLTTYQKRARLIEEFVASDDLNYAIDEQWASFYPYGQTANPGSTVATEVQVWNHSTVDREFTVKLSHPMMDLPGPKTLSIPARNRGTVSFEIEIPETRGHQYVITADLIRGDGVEETAFCETLIRVGSPTASKEETNAE